MAFSPPEYCRLFAQKKAYQVGITGTPGPPPPPLATPLCEHCKRTNRSTISLFFYINDLEVSIYLFWHLRVGGREVMETGWTVDWLPVVWFQLFKLSFFRSLRSLFSHNPMCPYKLEVIVLSSGSSFRLFPSRYISEFLRLPSNFPDKLGWLSIDRLSFFSKIVRPTFP